MVLAANNNNFTPIFQLQIPLETISMAFFVVFVVMLAIETRQNSASNSINVVTVLRRIESVVVRLQFHELI